MKFIFYRHLSFYFAVGLLLLAELSLRVLSVPSYIIPTPSLVGWTVLKEYNVLLANLWVTLLEAIVGFLGGNIIAITMGFIFSRFIFLRKGLFPILIAMQAIPLVALAPFIIIWFGPGFTGKAVMAGVLCYFPAAVIATSSFSRVNRDALSLLESFGFSRLKIFLHLRLPSSIPGIFSVLQVSTTLCTVGAIVAEMTGANRGIGFIITMSSYEFDTPMLFAALAVISSCTIAFFSIIGLIGGRYAKKYSFSYSTE